MNKFKKTYTDFLKSKIEEYCNEDGYYEIYWDYRDNIDANDIMEAFRNFKEKGFTNVEDYLEDELYSYNINMDDELISVIEKELFNQDFFKDDFEKWYYDNCNIYEDLCINGYNGIDINLFELLKHSDYCINIMLATDEEKNSDMSNIISSFGTYHLPDFEYMSERSFDNSLTYLIHQQGYTCREYFNVLNQNQHGYGMDCKCNFIESIVDEVTNCTADCMAEITVLVRVNGKELVEFLNYLCDENRKLNLCFSKDSEIGIFNEWIGSGSLLGINLEKELVISKDMIRNIQIEGAKSQSYTVNEVYGLIGSCWRNVMSYTKEEPKLMIENINETIQNVLYINSEIEEVI